MASRVDGSLIGRRDSLQRLVAEFRQVQTGAPSLVAVTGEAGLGKTAFLHRFAEEVEELDSSARVAYGRSLAQHSTASGFQPVREAIADLVNSEQHRDSTLKRLGQGFRAVAPDWLAAVPLAGDALAAAARTAEVLTKPGAVRLETSMTRQFCDLVGDLLKDGPLVLLLDDLHWADASTVDLIYSLSQLVTSGPFLLVCAYRERDLYANADESSQHPLLETMLRIERYRDIEEVQLTHFTMDHSMEMAMAVLRRPVTDEFVADLHQVAGGNPLFLNEYLGLILDAQSENRIRLEPDEILESLSSTVPSRVEAVVEERVLRLSAAERRTLEVASILGPVFAPEELLSIIDLDESTVRRSLRSLCRKHALIGATTGTEAQTGYSFHHATVLHVLSASLKQADILDYQSLHRAAADDILARGSEHLAELERLAHHASECGDRELALESANRAAAAAWEIGAVSEALKILERGTEPLDQSWEDLDELETAIWRRTEALTATANHAEAAALVDRCLRARIFESRPIREIRLEQARALRMLNDWEGAKATLDQAGLTQELPDLDVNSSQVAESLVIRGEIALCGNPQAIEQAIELFSEVIERSADAEHLFRAEGHIGLCYLASYRPREAFDALDRALVTAAATGHPWHLYEARHWRSKAEIACLRLNDAMGSLDYLDSVTASSGVASAVPFHLRDRARTLTLMNSLDEGAAVYASYLRSVSAHLNKTQWHRALSTLLCQIAEARQLALDTSQLLSLLTDAVNKSSLSVEDRADVLRAIDVAKHQVGSTPAEDALAALGIAADTFAAAYAIYRFDVPDLERLRQLSMP